MPKGVYPRTDVQRRAASERMRRLWRDPETRARWSAASHERLVARNSDPAFRARIRPKVRAANRSEAKRAKLSAAQARTWTAERRARQSAEMTRRMADPVKRAAAAAAARRGTVKRLGTFFCPPRLRKLYRKLRAELGAAVAQREIRRLNVERQLGSAA